MRERFIPESEINKKTKSTPAAENKPDSSSQASKREFPETRKSDQEILESQKGLLKKAPEFLKKLPELYKNDSFKANQIAAEVISKISDERMKTHEIMLSGNKKAKKIADKLEDVSEEILSIMAEQTSKLHGRK